MRALRRHMAVGWTAMTEAIQAQQLYDRGLHVFPGDHPGHPECIGLHGPNSPCDGKRGKHPAVKFGVWAVTVTPQMIDLEWRKHGGLANTAVACGRSNLVILDEDEPGRARTLVRRLRHHPARHVHGHHRPRPAPVLPLGPQRDAHRQQRKSNGRLQNRRPRRRGLRDRRGLPARNRGDLHRQRATHSQAARAGRADSIAGAPTDNGQPHKDAGQFWEQHDGRDYDNDKIDFHDRHKKLVAYAGRFRKSGIDYQEAEPAFRQRWLLCEQPEGQIPEAKFHSTDCPYPVTWEEAEAKLRDVFERYAAGQNLDDDAATAAGDDTFKQDDDHIRAFKFPDGHRPTDVGNAHRLLQHAGGRIRYVHAWGKWIVYQRGRWIIDEKDALVTETAKKVAKGLYALAAKTAAKDPDEAKPIWDWALKSDTSGAIAAMIRLARGAPGILVDHEQLDADPWLLNVSNGTIDLRTGRLRDHDPADLCILQAPVAYDPDATAPLWESCVERWQPDDAVRDYVQVRAGAGATGIPTETVDVDYGCGGNGKSKFHGAVQHVLGPYATMPHKSLIVAGRFEQHATVVADLFRKRLAVASETKQAEDLDDESVKNLTGGDRLKGRRMREDPWEFWPTHTLVMFSNHKPTVQGRDEGIWRRLRLVPWQVTIPENKRDEHLATKLQAEAPGILKWIVDGAGELPPRRPQTPHCGAQRHRPVPQRKRTSSDGSSTRCCSVSRHTPGAIWSPSKPNSTTGAPNRTSRRRHG